MLRSYLCDYNYAYIVVKERISDKATAIDRNTDIDGKMLHLK